MKFKKYILLFFIIFFAISTITSLKSETDKTLIYQKAQKQHEREKESESTKYFSHWLEIPETNINYPVAQGSNNSFYLTHDYYGNYNPHGSLFLDFHTNEDTTNYVIHGHAVNLSPKRPMFAMLLDYKRQSFIKKHKIIYFDEEPYEIIAVMTYNINNLKKWNYMQREFTEEEFERYKSNIKKYAFYYDDSIKLQNKHKNIITLSTCNASQGKDYRLLVIAQRKENSQ